MPRRGWILVGVGAVLGACFLATTCATVWWGAAWLGRGVPSGPGSTVPAEPTVEDLPPPTPQPLIEVPTPPPPPESETLALLSRTQLPVRDLWSLVGRLRGSAGPLPRVVRETPVPYALGDTSLFWVQDEELSDTYFQIEASLLYANEVVYMWVQEGLRLDGRDLIEAADEFANRIYPTNRQIFGSEWTPGVDGDPRLHILNASLPSVGGYFSSADEHSSAINPFSNEREMFYINAASIPPGSGFYRSVLAHEFQHMIHWHQDANEGTWINEGLAELAVLLNGYRVGVFAFPEAPDTQLTGWTDEIRDSGPHYDASLLFASYLQERMGDAFIRRWVEIESDGVVGFDETAGALGLDISFDRIFADWVIANYLDDPALGEGRYGHQNLRVWTVPEAEVERFPFRATGATVHQYATDYYEISPAGESRSIRFSGEEEVRVLATRPRSGQFFWWSNRGDMSDTTLTRAFDLSGVDSATLEARFWYDIEDDYDYAYVLASADAGDRWEILSGSRAVSTNPYGNNLGTGYTGRSGGWVPVEFDLTPYAGGEVWVRFEMVTDDAYNDPGLAVDDISIPEIGYFDDAEACAGWEAEGFVCINNILPQRWAVQLIEFRGDDVSVRWIEVDPSGQAEHLLDRDVTRAVLAVSGATPFTTEVANYDLTIE
ncbi:MAG: hypothetical protein ACE5NC_01980 [Anaerolineae bacterium]